MLLLDVLLLISLHHTSEIRLPSWLDDLLYLVLLHTLRLAFRLKLIINIRGSLILHVGAISILLLLLQLLLVCAHPFLEQLEVGMLFVVFCD